jgi:hypothetical protein
MLWLQNEHEPNHALQVMFLKDLPLRRCPGEYWDLPVCLVRVGHSNPSHTINQKVTHLYVVIHRSVNHIGAIPVRTEV